MKRGILAVLVACIAFNNNTLLLSQDAALPEVDERHPPVLPADLVPVLRFSRRDKIEVEYDFINTSNQGFRYLKGWNGNELYGLDFILTLNRRVIRPLEMTESPAVVEANIGTLRPGRRIRIRIDLHKRFGDLKPGEYELAVSYIWREKALPLTLIDLKKAIATIIIQ